MSWRRTSTRPQGPPGSSGPQRRTVLGCWPGSRVTLVVGALFFLTVAWLLIRATAPHYGTVSIEEVSRLTGLSFPPTTTLTNSCIDRGWQPFLLAKLGMSRDGFAQFRGETLLSGRWSSEKGDMPPAVTSEGMPYAVAARRGWWKPEKAKQLAWVVVSHETDARSDARDPFRELLEVLADLDDPQMVVLYVAAQ